MGSRRSEYDLVLRLALGREVDDVAGDVFRANVHARETFRHHSYFSDIAVGTISGLGAVGYELALRAASQQLAAGKSGHAPLPN